MCSCPVVCSVRNFRFLWAIHVQFSFYTFYEDKRFSFGHLANFHIPSISTLTSQIILLHKFTAPHIDVLIVLPFVSNFAYVFIKQEKCRGKVNLIRNTWFEGNHRNISLPELMTFALHYGNFSLLSINRSKIFFILTTIWKTTFVGAKSGLQGHLWTVPKVVVV